jgi:hypothetical protein
MSHIRELIILLLGNRSSFGEWLTFTIILSNTVSCVFSIALFGNGIYLGNEIYGFLGYYRIESAQIDILRLWRLCPQDVVFHHHPEGHNIMAAKFFINIVAFPFSSSSDSG